MPLIFTYFEEYKFLHLDYQGDVGINDLLASYDDLNRNSKYEGMKYAFNDLRPMTSSRLFENSLDYFGDMVADDTGKMANPWKIALMTNDPSTFVMARDYSQKFQRLGLSVCEAFQDADQAVKWMGADPKTLDLSLPKGDVIRTRRPNGINSASSIS